MFFGEIFDLLLNPKRSRDRLAFGIMLLVLTAIVMFFGRRLPNLKQYIEGTKVEQSTNNPGAANTAEPQK